MDEVATSRVMSAKRSRNHQDEQESSEQPVERRDLDKRRKAFMNFVNFVANKEMPL